VVALDVVVLDEVVEDAAQIEVDPFVRTREAGS
jgi:hypothetical protein